MAEAANIRVWEEAEIARSRSEASHTPVDSLRLSAANLRRYLDPPADTAFPLEYVFHVLGDVAGKVVLDLGCGNGENSILLAHRQARLVGIDVSESLLGLAQKRFALNDVTAPAVFVASSAHEIALPDESVDVVVGIAILHHLDLPLVAREVKRILRPGGRAIFKEPVRESRTLTFLRGLIPYRAPDVSPFERPLTEAELRQFAQGFKSYSSRAFSLPFVNLVAVVPFLKKWIFVAYRLDGAILRRAPFLKHFASVRVIELVK
jgi:ubiquinone/menaquinone biosynthesis C-methylase UbiE